MLCEVHNDISLTSLEACFSFRCVRVFVTFRAANSAQISATEEQEKHTMPSSSYYSFNIIIIHTII